MYVRKDAQLRTGLAFSLGFRYDCGPRLSHFSWQQLPTKLNLNWSEVPPLTLKLFSTAQPSASPGQGTTACLRCSGAYACKPDCCLPSPSCTWPPLPCAAKRRIFKFYSHVDAQSESTVSTRLMPVIKFQSGIL